MLTTMRPYLLDRQMNTGTVDFRPPVGRGQPALANTAAQAPAYSTIGIGFARASGENSLNEVLCFFDYSGGPSPAVVSDRRAPDAFVVAVRETKHAFGGTDSVEAEAAFKRSISAFRSMHGYAIAVMESCGERHADLQSKTHYTNASCAPDTFDVLNIHGGSVGAGFIVRNGATTTSQHWVMFGALPFDRVRYERRVAGGYASLHTFLDAMQDARDLVGFAFPHAVESFTHYLDVPTWA